MVDLHKFRGEFRSLNTRAIMTIVAPSASEWNCASRKAVHSLTLVATTSDRIRQRSYERERVELRDIRSRPAANLHSLALAATKVHGFPPL